MPRSSCENSMKALIGRRGDLSFDVCSDEVIGTVDDDDEGRVELCCFSFRDKCLEQKLNRCDSFEQFLNEHSRRHCFPLNRFRT